MLDLYGVVRINSKVASKAGHGEIANGGDWVGERLTRPWTSGLKLGRQLRRLVWKAVNLQQANLISIIELKKGNVG